FSDQIVNLLVRLVEHRFGSPSAAPLEPAAQLSAGVDMTDNGGKALGAATAVTILVTMALATPAFPQSTPAPAKNASINTYYPELLRLQQKSDWSGLEQLSRQALNALQAQLSPDSMNVASAADWLGLALSREGRFAEAEPLLRRALATYEKVRGPSDPDTAAIVK